jgi:carbonic anhydrase/acetyltransferase-like protein (isoleucine patch superfamily)
MLCEILPEKINKFEKTLVAGFLVYIESVCRNRMSRLRGMWLKLYLLMHGCKVGKGLKCGSLPYFKGFPNGNVSIGDHVDLGRLNTIELSANGRLIFEDYVLLHQNILISCNSQIAFRKWASVAENVSIRDGNHRFAKNEYFRKQETVTGPIEIGEGSGIAAGCVVLMGAHIGKGAFIGSNSVITRKDKVEDNGIYAGNPLRLIRMRE